MFLSMVSHWPFECQRTSETSKNLEEDQAMRCMHRHMHANTRKKTDLGEWCMSLGLTWLNTCIIFWAALCCWISFEDVKQRMMIKLKPVQCHRRLLGASPSMCSSLTHPQTKLQRRAPMEVPLPGTNHLGPEGFDHVHQTRFEHVLFCPCAQHPAALPQTPIQRALLAGEGLQHGRQAS